MAPLGSLLKQASFEQYERVARDNDTPTDFPCSFVEFSDDTSWCIERWPGWHFRRTSARNFKVGDFNQVYICNNEGHAEGSAILMTLVNIHRIQTSEFHWKQQCLTTCRAGRSRSLTEALCTGQSRKTKHAQAWQPEKHICILDASVVSWLIGFFSNLSWNTESSWVASVKRKWANTLTFVQLLKYLRNEFLHFHQ